MKKWVIAVIIVILLIILGFIIGLFYPFTQHICTEMACQCLSGPNKPLTGERPCNNCDVNDPIFVTGIFNIVKSCSAREIIICEDGARVDVRYDLEPGSCKTSYLFFKLYT